MRDPYSLEAEQGVLGAMLIRPDLIADIAAEVTATDFYYADHVVIFRTIVAMDDGRSGIDVVSVADKIGRFENGDFAMGYLGEIQRNTPSAANAMTYTRIVKERSLDRKLIDAAQQVHDLAHSDSPTADKVAQAQAAVLAIDGSTEDNAEAELEECLPNHIEILQYRHDNKGKLDGLATGYKDLDDALMGLKGGQLVIVAGRAKMGKTTAAMGIVRHNAIRTKKHGAVFTMEMSRVELIDRMIAAEGSVPLTLIKNGEAMNDYATEITAAFAKINTGCLTILDRPGWNMSKIRTWCRKRKRRKGLDYVVIDHLGLLDGEMPGQSPLQRMTEATRQAKLLAKELDIPVIAICQLNRALEQRADKRPMPSDLRDSGTIEQDADIVLFVYRDDVYNPDGQHKGIGEIIIGLARDVECKTIYTLYQGQFNRFRDLAAGYQLPEPEEKPRRGRGMNFD
jgi:replicative DNA helicase